MTYREKDSETSSLEEKLENSSSSDEKEQSSKKDSTSEDIELVNEETEQLVTKILSVVIKE